jgi:Fe-S cluster biogenesis protein NfuA
MPALVETAATPNPDALMFRTDELLIPSGTVEVRRGGRVDDAPLAAQLLRQEGVELVLIAPRFVTVRKQAGADWAWLEPQVRASLEAFLESGEMAVYEDVAAAASVERSDVEQRILALLEDEIRPAIAQDGGDVIYLGFAEGTLRLRLIGSCGTCPSSITTLKQGIERLLMEEVPEVREVINEAAA